MYLMALIYINYMCGGNHYATRSLVLSVFLYILGTYTPYCVHQRWPFQQFEDRLGVVVKDTCILGVMSINANSINILTCLRISINKYYPWSNVN
jgi:hypothetical protein